MKKILLLGANGRTGREILGRALSAGGMVTALVRGEDRLADVSHSRLDVHVGSPCDPRAIEPLLPGHDAVISVLGPRWPSKAASAIYPESAAALVDAMQHSDVNRLLVTSSALLFPTDSVFVGALRWIVSSIVNGARRMEDHIGASNLEWTIARTGFLNNDGTTIYRLGEQEFPERAGSVSRAAVASFLLDEVEQRRHLRQVVGLCG